MENLDIKIDVATEIKIDLATGEILTPLIWDTAKKRYVPHSKDDLSIWELHLIEGSSKLREWAKLGAMKYIHGRK